MGEDIESYKWDLTGSGMCAVRSGEGGNLLYGPYSHGSSGHLNPEIYLDPDYRSVERPYNTHCGWL